MVSTKTLLLLAKQALHRGAKDEAMSLVTLAFSAPETPSLPSEEDKVLKSLSPVDKEYQAVSPVPKEDDTAANVPSPDDPSSLTDLLSGDQENTPSGAGPEYILRTGKGGDGIYANLCSMIDELDRLGLNEMSQKIIACLR